MSANTIIQTSPLFSDDVIFSTLLRDASSAPTCIELTETTINVVEFAQLWTHTLFKLVPELALPVRAPSLPNRVTPADVASCVIAWVFGCFSEMGLLSYQVAGVVPTFPGGIVLPNSIADYVIKRSVLLDAQGRRIAHRRLSYVDDWQVSSSAIAPGPLSNDVSVVQSLDDGLSSLCVYDYNVPDTPATWRKDVIQLVSPIGQSLFGLGKSWYANRYPSVSAFLQSLNLPGLPAEICVVSSIERNCDGSGFASPRSSTGIGFLNLWNNTALYATCPVNNYDPDIAMVFSYGGDFIGEYNPKPILRPDYQLDVYQNGGRSIVPPLLTRRAQVVQQYLTVTMFANKSANSPLGYSVISSDGDLIELPLLSNFRQYGVAFSKLCGAIFADLMQLVNQANGGGYFDYGSVAGIIAGISAAIFSRSLQFGCHETIVSWNEVVFPVAAPNTLWSVQAMYPASCYGQIVDLPAFFRLSFIKNYMQDGFYYTPMINSTLARTWSTASASTAYNQFPVLSALPVSTSSSLVPLVETYVAAANSTSSFPVVALPIAQQSTNLWFSNTVTGNQVPLYSCRCVSGNGYWQGNDGYPSGIFSTANVVNMAKWIDKPNLGTGVSEYFISDRAQFQSFRAANGNRQCMKVFQTLGAELFPLQMHNLVRSLPTKVSLQEIILMRSLRPGCSSVLRGNALVPPGQDENVYQINVVLAGNTISTFDGAKGVTVRGIVSSTIPISQRDAAALIWAQVNLLDMSDSLQYTRALNLPYREYVFSRPGTYGI